MAALLNLCVKFYSFYRQYILSLMVSMMFNEDFVLETKYCGYEAYSSLSVEICIKSVQL